jgi:hypothetical protein
MGGCIVSAKIHFEISPGSKFQFFRFLPPPLFYELRSLLSPACYYRLLTTSKALDSVLRDTRMIVLRNPHDLEVVLSKINHPRSQLVLRIPTGTDESVSFVIRKLLNFPSCKNVLTSQMVCRIFSFSDGWHRFSESTHSVEIENVLLPPQQLEQMTLSESLKEFHLRNEDRFHQMPQHLRDLRCFSHLQKLTLHNCPTLSDLRPLQNLQFLALKKCFQITDVRCLGKIDTLFLENCPGIVDIFALNNNRKLTIFTCRSVNLATINFGNVRYLHTDLLTSYEQTAQLNSCYSMNLEGYRDFKIETSHAPLRQIRVNTSKEIRLDNFSHLFSVSLRRMPSLDLSPLFSVPNVILSDLGIVSLTGLGGNQSVEVVSCFYISDFSPLKNVPRVLINANGHLLDGNGLVNVQDLTIESCGNFHDTSSLRNVKRLKLQSCDALRNITSLENVAHLEMQRCHKLVSFQGLGNNIQITVDRHHLRYLESNRKLSNDHYDIFFTNNHMVTLSRKRF